MWCPTEREKEQLNECLNSLLLRSCYYNKQQKDFKIRPLEQSIPVSLLH